MQFSCIASVAEQHPHRMCVGGSIPSALVMEDMRMNMDCENCENAHFCLTLSWKEDIDVRVIDVYPKIIYGKDYC